jgi:hypothetical protein
MEPLANDSFVKIPVKEGDNILYAIVDKGDIDKVLKYSWYFDGRYAMTSINRVTCRLHAYVMNKLDDKDLVIDHIDGDKLNNMKSNLRYATFSQNVQNKKSKGAASGYRGVVKMNNKWLSRITYKNIMYNLGVFDEKELAAKEYDKMSYRIYGEHAYTNNLLSDAETKTYIENPIDEKGLKAYKLDKNRIIGVYPVQKANGEVAYKAKVGNMIVGTYKTSEQAIKAREKAVKDNADRKAQDIRNKEVERDEDGDAIIQLKNFGGEVVGIVKVDDEDWYKLITHSWSFNNNRYAIANIKKQNTLMHKYLMPGHDMIDHIDGNGLNNKKANLRPIDYSGNAQNKKKKENCTSKYIGVYLSSDKKHFIAEIKKNYKKIYIGRFKTEIDAANAYNNKALEYYENPKLNDV